MPSTHLANLILAEVTYQRRIQTGASVTRRQVWENPATWGVEV